MSGAGVNISPVAFLVIQENNIKLLPINYTSAIDKLLDYVPDLMDKVNNIIHRTMTEKEEELKKKCKEEIENDKIKQVEEIKKEEKVKLPKRNKKNYEIEYDETTEIIDEDNTDY